MHPNLDELLAHRDGEGTVETARHVERCAECQSAVEELKAVASALGELPSIPPPDESWDHVRNRVLGQRGRSIGVRLAMVAAAVIAVATVVFMNRLETPEGARTAPSVEDPQVAIEQLSHASRELEVVLRETTLQNRVLSTRRAAMIVELEDRIALVDLALTLNADVAPDQRAIALWSDRVELLDALVTVRGGKGRSNEGVTHAVNQE